MAEFVTRKENIRRWILMAFCALLFIVGIIMYVSRKNDCMRIETGQMDEEGAKKVSTDDLVSLRVVLDIKKKEYREHLNRLIQYSEPIGSRIFSPGTWEHPASTGVLVPQLKSFLNFWVREMADVKRWGANAKTQYLEWGREKETGKIYMHLTDLFKDLKDVEEKIKAETQKIQGETQKLIDEAQTIQKRQYEEQAKRLEEIVGKDKTGMTDGLIKQIKDKNRARFEKQVNYAKELSELKEKHVTVGQELTVMRRSNLQTEVALQLIDEDLRKRINAVKSRKVEARLRMDADGRVMHVDSDFQIVHLDLALKDKVFIGNIFQVFGIHPGGVKYVKGEVEIFAVDASGSRAIILRNDDRDPMRADDFVWNENYERGRKKRFVFAGNLVGVYSREELAHLLRKVGDEYQTSVDEQTNYLILGDRYKDDPNFVEAAAYDMKFIVEKDLYSYLGVPWNLRRKS